MELWQNAHILWLLAFKSTNLTEVMSHLILEVGESIRGDFMYVGFLHQL